MSNHRIKLNRLKAEKHSLVKEQKFEQASEVRNIEIKLIGKMYRRPKYRHRLKYYRRSKIGDVLKGINSQLSDLEEDISGLFSTLSIKLSGIPDGWTKILETKTNPQ